MNIGFFIQPIMTKPLPSWRAQRGHPSWRCAVMGCRTSLAATAFLACCSRSVCGIWPDPENSQVTMDPVGAAGRGNEKNFASEADVVEKFHKLAALAISKTQAAQVVTGSWLEKCSDASDLPRLLTPH